MRKRLRFLIKRTIRWWLKREYQHAQKRAGLLSIQDFDRWVASYCGVKWLAYTGAGKGKGHG